MKPPVETCVGTFHATYAVLKAEKILTRLGISVKTVPVPRQISSSCGISIRFACDQLDRIREAFAPISQDLEGIYRQQVDGSYQRV